MVVLISRMLKMGMNCWIELYSVKGVYIIEIWREGKNSKRPHSSLAIKLSALDVDIIPATPDFMVGIA